MWADHAGLRLRDLYGGDRMAAQDFLLMHFFMVGASCTICKHHDSTDCC